MPSSSSSLLSFAIARLSKLFTPDNLNRVNSHGYLIIDNALPTTIANSLYEEILSCHSNGLMDSNHTAFVESNSDNNQKSSITKLFPKPNIYEVELLPEILNSSQVIIPTLNSLTNELIPFIDAKFGGFFENLLLYEGDTSIKLQVNRGNGCFPFHYDSPGGLKDTRRLTCLIYLNKLWALGDGGEIVFQPFLNNPIHIAPLFNRIVIFRSDRMLHRVNVSKKQRVCLTIWLHGRGDDSNEKIINNDDENDNVSNSENVNNDYVNDWMSSLQLPSVQRVLSKSLYGEEWKESYQRAHAGNEGILPLLHSLIEEKKSVIYKGQNAADVDGNDLGMEENTVVEEDSNATPKTFKHINTDDLDFLSFL